jgi:hypothetical protein
MGKWQRYSTFESSDITRFEQTPILSGGAVWCAFPRTAFPFLEVIQQNVDVPHSFEAEPFQDRT